MSLIEPDEAVAARCRECERDFFVTSEATCCPYCGETDVEVRYGVVVRPH